MLLVLIPLLCLVGSVSGTVEKEGQALDNKKKEGQGIVNSVPPNQRWVDAYKKQDVVVEKKQAVVWGQAYETQKDLITWPEELLVEYPAFKTKQFGDPITQYEASKFAEYYNIQVPAVLKRVQPLIPGAYFRTDSSVLPSPDDDQIVQFKGNNWNGVLQLLREFKRDGPPSREDVWLAQEDLWVKRELLAVIRAANDAIAHFKEVTPGQPPQPQPAPAGDAKVAKDAKDAKSAKPVPKPPPAPASDPNHKVFRNYFWEMELTLSRGPKQTYLLGGKLTNIGKRRQPLGVFRVYLDSSPDSDPTLLPIENEPLAVGQSVEFTKRPVDRGVNIRGLFGVEQVLTWRTAPVKRIDELRIDYHASRLSRRSLVEPRWVEKAAAHNENGA